MPVTGRALVRVLAFSAALLRQEPDASAAFGAEAGSVAPALPGGDPSGGGLFAQGLVEFLAWAHPAGGPCGAVERIEVLTRWPGGMRVRYETPCAGERRRLEALLLTREGPGVWQVAAGFETDEASFQAALRSRALRIPKETIPREGVVGGVDLGIGQPAEMVPPPVTLSEGGGDAARRSPAP